MKFKEHYGLEEKKGCVYDKSSTQFQFDDEVADKVKDYSARIPDEYIYTDDNDDSFGREDDIHTTVLYGLKDEQPDEVDALMKSVEPFEVKLGDISYFEPEDKPYDVMKVDVEGDDLHALNGLLQKSVEFDTDFPEYKPHCTVAYLKKGFPKDEVDTKMFNGLTQPVNEIIFSSSNGTKFPVRLAGIA